MKSVSVLAAILVVIVGIVFSTGFTGGEGWFWAIGNGFGFVALAGLFYLSMDARNGAKLKTHKGFSYVVIGLIAAHACWFLFGDPIVIEYLKAGAPAYMWSGLLGAVILVLVVFSSRLSNRMREYKSTRSFRFWHKWLAISVVATSLYHIIGSGFYLKYYGQWIGLSLVAIIVFLISKPGWFRDSNTWKLMLVCMASLIFFTAFRGVLR